jgi:hypothetical protein
MTLVPQSRVQDVTGHSSDEISRICDFLQGAVYCWCKNRPKEWFSLRDLMGGDNYHWQGTPLVVLYDRHIAAGLSSDDSVDRAGKDGGWLLKRVITDDRRAFNTREAEQIRQYLWDQAASPIDPNAG